MPRFNLRKFTDPDWLQTISPPRVVAFLNRWKDYLADRGFVLPEPGAVEIDYSALANVLMATDAATPSEMVDAIFHVYETCDPEDMEELRTKVAARGLEIDDDPEATAADYAIDVWLVDPSLLQEFHAETLARRQQNFEYFGGTGGVRRTFPAVPDNTRLAIESAFDDWFVKNNRGRGCRLLIFRHSPIVWILVRHGQLMRREASHTDDGTAAAAFYRPQLHDVLIYDERTDEIAVHSETRGAGKLYLRILGGYLFGDVDYFPRFDKYNLAPLVEQGQDALACGDIEGIEEVRLIEYRRYWGGEFKETEIRRASDIFGALSKRSADQKLSGRLSSAAFKIKFVDSPKERRLVIRAPSSARYERNTDSVTVEEWFRARGFML